VTQFLTPLCGTDKAIHFKFGIHRLWWIVASISPLKSQKSRIRDQIGLVRLQTGAADNGFTSELTDLVSRTLI